MKNSGGDKLKYINLIRDRLGIVTKPDSYHLTNTINDACKKFNCTPDEYLHQLEITTENSPYLEHLISGITIGETYFFRDKHQMQVLQDKILPDIITAKRSTGNHVIRIWSAGCSSGEEIYTLAMMLYELISDKSKWQLHLLGTDINLFSLKRAIAGQYSEWSMRSTPEKYKKTFFIKEKDKYQITDAIKNLVTFDYLNLSDDVYPSMINNTVAQDLIICRNVLIYFDESHVHMLMNRIVKCIVADGYLLLGSSDPIDLEMSSLVRSSLLPSLFKNVLSVKPKLLEEEKRESKVIKQLPKAVIHHASKRIAHPIKPVNKHEEIRKLAANSQWSDVIALIDSLGHEAKNDAYVLTTKASALANMGQIDEAITMCLKSLHIDRTNPLTYFTLAVAYSENNDIELAETAFRKSLFLDRNFAICYFQFGLFMIRHQHANEGQRLLNNALKISKKSPPNELVPYGGGLTYKRLGEILEHETELYSS